MTVHRALLREVGIDRVHAAVGGSLGGMQALQWSLDHPDEVERAVLVCASARLSAQYIAFSKVAREAILRHDGMAVARMIGPPGGHLPAPLRPHTFLLLSRVMDYFDPFAEHDGTPSTLSLVISFHIEAELTARGADVRRHEVRSPWGHDPFLMDVPEYHALLREFLA